MVHDVLCVEVWDEDRSAQLMEHLCSIISFACLKNNVTWTIHVQRRCLSRLANRSIRRRSGRQSTYLLGQHHTCAMPLPLCRCHRSCASGPSNHACAIVPLILFSSTNQKICSLARLPTEQASDGKTHHNMRRACAIVQMPSLSQIIVHSDLAPTLSTTLALSGDKNVVRKPYIIQSLLLTNATRRYGTTPSCSV